MKAGDLVKVAAKGLRTPIGSLGVITRVEEREDSRGTIVQYWAHMVESGHSFWFRLEYLEIINASR